MTVLTVLGAAVAVGIAIVIGTILNGYVLSVLWSWFIVPTFSAPPIALVPAIGIALVLGYLTHERHDCKNEKRSAGTELAEGIAYIIFRPLFALFFGWIIHMFM